MKWLSGWIALFVLFACAGVAAYVYGRRLPPAYTASVSGVVHAPEERVWELIDTAPEQANWRTGLMYTSSMPPQDHQYCWEEARGAIATPFCLQEEQAPVRRVARVALSRKGKRGPFTGTTWTWELARAEDGVTAVTITERASVHSVLWRLIGHSIRGEDYDVKQYMRDLQVEAVRQR